MGGGGGAKAEEGPKRFKLAVSADVQQRRRVGFDWIRFSSSGPPIGQIQSVLPLQVMLFTMNAA